MYIGCLIVCMCALSLLCMYVLKDKWKERKKIVSFSRSTALEKKRVESTAGSPERGVQGGEGVVVLWCGNGVETTR